MQSPDLTQLSESLLSLLSGRNDADQRIPSQHYKTIPRQQPFQPIQQQEATYSHPHSYSGLHSGVESGPVQLPGDQGTADDPWTSLHRLQADRQVPSSSGGLPSFTQASLGQHSAPRVEDNSGSSPHDNTNGFGSYRRDTEVSSQSLPSEDRFPRSTRTASGLWGGSLWSGGQDSIWSPAPDIAPPDNCAQPLAAEPQDNLLSNAHRRSLESSHGGLSSGFPMQQNHFLENGHAPPTHARPAHIPPNLSHERANELRQAPSALLAALQSGGQYATLNGSHRSMPSIAMANSGPHMHQGSHNLFQPQQQQHLQHQHQQRQHQQQQHQQHQQHQHQQQHQPLHHHQLQQHHLHQLQQQSHHQLQQPQHAQQAQQLPAAQPPPVPSHVGRMPPPGFPRPMQQNLPAAQQQRASAAAGFQSPQAGMNSLRSAGSGSQPPPPPPRPAAQPLPPSHRLQQANGQRNAKPPPGTSPSHPRLSGNRMFGHPAPKADMAQLSKSLLEVVDTLRPSPGEQQRQKEAFQQVRSVLLQQWTTAKVHLFGSTANCLSICNNNDIDVCLELSHDDQADKGGVVDQMGQLLEEAGMRDVLPLPKARVPVVKFVVPDTNTKVDITVNNILAIVNTKLLRDYAAVDSRLLQLVFVVKLWAKRRQVNDSYRGTLSSYCYVLMCIHLLQQRSPPVLPCLQAMQPTHTRTVGQWDCDYFDDIESLKDFGAANKEGLAELVWAFFEYWAWRHDYNNSVISIRTGGFLTKSQKEWTRRVGNERHLVCIEDPFEISHDLGRTVDRQTSGVLHKEFERAACIFRDLPQPLDKLMEPYRAGKPE